MKNNYGVIQCFVLGRIFFASPTTTSSCTFKPFLIFLLMGRRLSVVSREVESSGVLANGAGTRTAPEDRTASASGQPTVREG